MQKPSSAEPGIVIDTREQRPYVFPGLTTVRAKLHAGDYSLVGYENVLAVERKSLEDSYGCVGASRKRFEKCLERLSKLDRACIVIEADLATFSVPPSRTVITAQQAVGSYISWSCRFGIPVFWCGNRAYAERVTLRFLVAYLKYRAKEAK